MKKFLTFVVALSMTIPMMSIGRNDGSTKANAIDFDWETPMTHTSGTKWYVVNLDPLYEEETPALNLFLVNKDAFNETHTSLKATVAGQTEEKSFTIGPKQQRVWSANATMLVRLKQKEIYLTLTSDGPVLMSARVFEAEDLDETCKDALPLSWTTGITKPAGVPVWYKVNIKDAKANTAQDVCVVVTNNGTQKLTLIAGQSLDCPSSGVTKRTIELEAGQTLRDTVPNTMLTGVAFDELYVSLENDQPISVRVEYVDRPLIPVLPADPTGLVYTEMIVPDTSLHTIDVTTLSAGVTYYFKYDIAKLNALKKYEPEFTLRNIGTTQATIERKMAFDVPAYSAQGSTLVLEGNEESIEVLTKNTLIGLDNPYIYVKITSNQDIQLLSRFKHLREGKACKTNIDFDWINGHTQSASTKLWYAIDVADARDNIEDIVVHVENLGDKTASIDAAVAFSCPYIDLQEIHHNIAAGATEVRTLGYSTYAMMTDTIWIGVETSQNIKFWATTQPTQTTEPDEACLNAVNFNWEEGAMQHGGDTVWYKISMDEAREKSAKFPTVFVQNLSSTNPATITGELSLECPDSIANQKRTKTLAANESYRKQLSRNLFENIVQDTIYLKVITTEDIALQIRLTEATEGSDCSSAIPFNWVSGNTQAANANLWYSVDLRDVMKRGNDLRLHMENKDNAASKGVIQLSYECPVMAAPSIKDFSLTANGTANGEKSVTIQNSTLETLEDSMVYVNLQGTTALRFWADTLAVEPFDTILAVSPLKVLKWDSLYTQTEDTVWYIIPKSEIDKVNNKEDKVKPVAHLWNIGTAENTYKVEAAFAFPIVKNMMTKSQKLAAGKHFSDTVPASTFDQFLKKDSIIVRITRPVGSADFQFRAELVGAFGGNTRADALPIRLNQQYTQSPNTEMWYKVNTANLKKDKTLFNKALLVIGKNAGTGDAEVQASVYEGLLSEVDLLEEYGLGDYRKRTVKKGQSKSHNIPAQAVYAVGDVELYIKLRTTDSLVFETKFNGEYAPQAVDPKQKEAILVVPNVEYVVPGDNKEHWYMSCVPYIQNNYIYTDGSTFEYDLNGMATIEVTATFQDEMDCKMPVRKRTINSGGGHRHGTKPVRELIEKAIKKAGKNFDFSGTDPQFIDSLLHRFITKDSITLYVRVKTNQDLKVRLNTPQTTGNQCTNPMAFDWEHGNVNPASADTWYQVQLDSLIIPDTCDLRLHVDNWANADNHVVADMYFDCNEPKTKGQDYTLPATGKDSIDIDRDFLQQLGWADMIINYVSDETSHIWAELIPNTPREILRDTIVAYVCQGGSYTDTITGVIYDPIDYSIQWYDTVAFKDGVTMKDSITLFDIHPLVSPEAISVDSMKNLGAAPLLAQGMQLFVDSSNVRLTAYYKALGISVDTIPRIDTVYWAKPEYQTNGDINYSTHLPLDLTSYYSKTDLTDTLMLVIESDTCGFVYRKEVVFPIEAYKYAHKNDTVCPPAPAMNPDTIGWTVLVPDTMGLPRQIDTVITYLERVLPTLYTSDEITLKPTVANDALIDTTWTLSALKQQFENDADALTMKVTDAKWQVKVGDAWQDLPYTVGHKATSVTMRYVITTECGDVLNSENVDFALTPDPCDPTSGTAEPVSACDEYYWAFADSTITTSGTYTHVGLNVGGCDSTLTLTVTIHQSQASIPTPVESCDSYYWAEADTTITMNGTYTHVFTTTQGCDSTVTLGVTIYKSTSSVETPVVTCDEYYWASADTTIKASGAYTHVFSTIHGCDSVVTLNATINKSADVTADPVTECNSYYWAFADSTIITSGTYTHTGATIAGCDSMVTINVTINVPYETSLSLVHKYGNRLIMINRNEINAIPGWQLDSLDIEHPEYVIWHEIDLDGNDTEVGTGYYYTLASGEPLPTGYTYYAVIEIPATAGAVCGAKGETEHYTIPAPAGVPALVPSLARPGEEIRIINLDPETRTMVRIYSADGLLQATYRVAGQETYTIKAAEARGFYMVELSNDEIQSTLRYIVK